jgi:hypothetical protein
VWLAKLTERGMLRPSFVPPPEIRRLRELTRLRADLVHERTRYWARLDRDQSGVILRNPKYTGHMVYGRTCKLPHQESPARPAPEWI